MKSLQVKHVEDMQAQMSAHKVTVDSLRDQAEKHLQVELQAQREIAQKEQGKKLGNCEICIFRENLYSGFLIR